MNMKKAYLLTGLAAGFFAFSAHAAAIPKGAAYDKRIQYVNYNPDNVVVIRAEIGRAVLVQLAQDERVEGENKAIVAGNTGAWKLKTSGNNIFFKPTTETPETNLLISTNKRTYAFDLRMAGRKQPPTYILRFRYPEEAARLRQAEAQKRQEARRLAAMHSNGRQALSGANYNYWAYGEKTLAPSGMWDDGRFTYLKFDDAREMPTVFKVSPDGTESTVNTHMEQDTLVVHDTFALYYLRLGKKVLGVENRSYDSKGKFNYRGTTVAGAVRMKKGK